MEYGWIGLDPFTGQGRRRGVEGKAAEEQHVVPGRSWIESEILFCRPAESEIEGTSGGVANNRVWTCRPFSGNWQKVGHTTS